MLCMPFYVQMEFLKFARLNDESKLTSLSKEDIAVMEFPFERWTVSWYNMKTPVTTIIEKISFHLQ